MPSNSQTSESPHCYHRYELYSIHQGNAKMAAILHLKFGDLKISKDCCILVTISLKLVPKSPISKKTSIGSNNGWR